MTTELQTRREAIRRFLLLTGAAMVGSQALLRGASLAGAKSAAGFSDTDIALLDEIGETILPATDIPGAKAVQIGAFMAMIVTDCYTDDEHAQFVEGMAAVDAASQTRFGQTFIQCTTPQRSEIITALDAEAHAFALSVHRPHALHYFRMFKDLTLLGYFTSEVGCTKAVRYIEVPGYYRGDVPYKQGDPAWATA